MPSQRKRPAKSNPSRSTEKPAAKRIDSIEELVSLVGLENIIFHEERARRVVWDADDPELEDLPRYRNSLGISQAAESITFRFRMVFTDKDAEYASDVAAVYSTPVPLALGADLLTEFAERVGFMSVYPFLRASIYGGAARLGQPIPVLGLIRQGDFHIEDSMSEEEARAAFLDNVSETVAADS